MRYTGFIISLMIIAACQKQPEKVVETEDNVLSYVDPFIGTGGKGKTYPGATVPFGMVQLSPDNGRSGWDWISGYFYPDSVIAGFSHTHLSGTGIGDLYDISFMPVAYPLPQERSDSLVKAVGSPYYSLFSHDKEKASPGYYQVFLEDYGINVELTATKRTGLQKYSVTDKDSLQVFLNLGYARNWDSTTDAHIEVVNDSLIIGYRKSTGWAPDQRVYFASVFSEPFEEVALYTGDSIVNSAQATGKNLQGVFTFKTLKKGHITIKTGISSVSTENALFNLTSESARLSFDEAKTFAADTWSKELNKIKVSSADTQRLTSFYTALYQSMLAPTLFSGINGQYKGADGNIHQAQGYDRYTTFSLWDTFRAEHPLLTILQPDRVDDFINSMLAHYDEYGYLPVWDLAGNETNMMIGYHAAPVIADAYLKGFRGFDIEKAYEAMKKSAEADHFGLNSYKKLGYVAATDDNESVSLTLEYAYDDWCIAQVAKALNKADDHERFLSRSENYLNLFDPETKFMRAKDSLGNWKSNFNPTQYNSGDYIEANAWHYTWFVPHQPEKLAELMGGKEKFRGKLDALFNTPQSDGPVPEWISGYIGQYVHGNEPCHHIPYLYNYTDQPWQTGEKVRAIMDQLYKAEPAGLCGNEDCGQMSAWYIFSALGFYPLNPASGEYELGVPLFEEVSLTLPGDKKLLIRAEGLSDKNRYVSNVTFNGKEVNTHTISHETLTRGGELIFSMAEEPARNTLD